MRPFQPPDFRRIQIIQQRLEDFPMRHAVGAVQAFESVEDQNQPLDVPPIQHAVLAIQRMRHRVRRSDFVPRTAPPRRYRGRRAAAHRDRPRVMPQTSR
jgi:hypothetical protein